ncbi:PE family protein [Mycobacterium avium subsp. hominissuis]|uniref:PE family protein n=1 Tax=Mycobacterium TaxID=1763 RepID=UPI0002A58207|nr:MULTISPECIES: PE family protein [Mycobacterium]AGB27318.1 PE family protein [Mycobacterium sp. JS623]MDO2394816.1 PE family protein [Mycobacterium avium subsp. hominissuis]
MQLDVTPEALEAASAQVAALTGHLLAVNASHMVANHMILPPGSDIASIKTAASLQAQGVDHDAMAAMGNFQMAASSYGVAESGVSYATGDAENVATYTAAGGFV